MTAPPSARRFAFLFVWFYTGLVWAQGNPATSGNPATAASKMSDFAAQRGAGSVSDGVLIDSKYMFRDLVKKTAILKGSVQLVFKGQHMSCDQAVIDFQKQEIHAEGHVIMYNSTAHIEGDRVVFNYQTNTGYIYNGFVQSGQVVFEGEVIEKVGEQRFLASNGEYTACETCPAGWSFSGRIIDAEIGGYARIQRPVFHIGGVPILILPSIIVPLKSRRQSGLLVPSMDVSSKGGLAPSMNYFWAIDRSQDMTMAARYYQKRGYKLMDDYRYVLSKDSRGDLQGAYMQDKELKNEYSLPSQGSISRWYTTYDHYYELPEDYVHRFDIHQVSDLRYARDFPDEIPGWGDAALENKMSITKTTENQYASIEGDMYTNQLKFYPITDNDDSVHRVPELKYSIKEKRLFENGPLIRLDADYTDFARNKTSYDNLVPCTSVAPSSLCTGYTYVPAGSHVDTQVINGTPTQVLITTGPHGEVLHTGNFGSVNDPNNLSLMRSGQRFDVMPTISYPFQIWHLLDVVPSITFRDTEYHFDTTEPASETGFEDSAFRRYVQTDIAARTEISHVFGDLTDPKSDRWKHSIEPEVGYSQIPWLHTPNHPFFGDFQGLQYARQYDPITDADIGNKNTGVQFDYNDRTFERRVITYDVTNRITRKVWNDGTPDYKTLALFKIGQSYDFKEAARGDGSHPFSTVDALLDMRFEHFETYTTESYSPYAHIGNTNMRVRGMITPKNFLQVTFTQNFNLNPIDYSVLPGQETRTFGVGSGFITRYVELLAQADYSDITHQMQDYQIGLNLRPPGRCWVIHFEHVQVVGGDPTTRGSVSFDFGGETKSEALAHNQEMNL